MKAAACVTLTLLSFPLTFVNWSVNLVCWFLLPCLVMGSLRKWHSCCLWKILGWIAANAVPPLTQCVGSFLFRTWNLLPHSICSPKVTLYYGSFLGYIIFLDGNYIFCWLPYLCLPSTLWDSSWKVLLLLKILKTAILY